MKSSPSLKWNWLLRNSCSQRELSKHRYTFEQINKSNSIWVRFAPLLILLFSIYQAVNKLAEIMNRKEVRGGGSRRGNDTDVRRKEKENRKLQLELRSEREKLNSTIIKYQREINDMQAVWPLFSVWRMPHCSTGSQNTRFLLFFYFLQQLADESQVRVELQMALDSKDSDIEQLRGLLNSLNVQSLDSASMSSGPDMDIDESLPGTVKVFSKLLFILLSLSILS